jgi:PAS domain S-box-containing protein
LKKSQEKLKQAADDLSKSRLRFELAIKGSNAGIWEWDILQNIVYNSSRWKAMLGYDDTELNNMTVESFVEKIIPEDRQMVKDALENHLHKKAPYQLEFRMVRKDGTTMWVADSGVAVFDADDKPTLMAGSIIDITDRKEVQHKIIHQNELLTKTNLELDRFVYSASHDLRSPLSSILGLINIAQKVTDPSEIETCLQLMQDQVNTLENFINEIQDYSRNSRKEIRLETIALDHFVTEIIESLKFSEKANRLWFECVIPNEIQLTTDTNRLRVILSNIIGNSIKYADLRKESPGITIESKMQNGVCILTVTDNGVGIADEHHSKIFDMFYRASESSKGSGLGLYIVKETLIKLGGEISFHSELGKGSTFEVKLPL